MVCRHGPLWFNRLVNITTGFLLKNDILSTTSEELPPAPTPTPPATTTTTTTASEDKDFLLFDNILEFPLLGSI